MQVMRLCGPGSRLEPAGPRSKRAFEKDRRLQIAQWAIRTMMLLGFDETEIADLTGVDHTTVAHILSPDGTRTVSQDTALAFREALRRAGQARLKLLLPQLRIQVLDTCCDKGLAVDERVGADMAERVRTLIRNALILASSPAPAVPGIHAFLAQIGDPEDGTYVFGAPSQENHTVEERIKHLEHVEHEVEHMLQRFRTERQRLEKLHHRQKPIAIPNAGRFA
jgi:hypothetical protein